MFRSIFTCSVSCPCSTQHCTRRLSRVVDNNPHGLRQIDIMRFTWFVRVTKHVWPGAVLRFPGESVGCCRVGPEIGFDIASLVEGVQTVKCKPWTERVAEKELSRGVSRVAWKRRINRELEAKNAHKPWIREGLNREVQTVNLALLTSKIAVFQFTVCTSWFARPWFGVEIGVKMSDECWDCPVFYGLLKLEEVFWESTWGFKSYMTGPQLFSGLGFKVFEYLSMYICNFLVSILSGPVLQDTTRLSQRTPITVMFGKQQNWA